MSNINETQRKYIRQRLTELKQVKQNEINNAYKYTARSRFSEDDVTRHEYIKAELSRVGLDWTMDSYGNITTPHDLQIKEENIEKEVQRTAKHKELSDLFNGLMDQVILGSDAEELASVLAALNDFKTN